MLCSYSFGLYRGHDDIADEYLNLFRSLITNPEKKVDYAGEIIFNALNGKIDPNNFWLDAYVKGIETKTLYKKNKRKNKEVFITYEDNGVDEEVLRKSGGIRESRLQATNNFVDAYEELLSEDTLTDAVEMILSMNKTLIIEEGIDLVYSIKQALKSVPEAISNVVAVCKNYDFLAEAIRHVMESDISFEELITKSGAEGAVMC